KRFFGLAVNFSERGFGIADSFRDNFQRFGHTLISLHSSVDTREAACRWVPWTHPSCQWELAASASSDSTIWTKPPKIHSKISQSPTHNRPRSPSFLIFPPRHLKPNGSCSRLNRGKLLSQNPRQNQQATLLNRPCQPRHRLS